MGVRLEECLVVLARSVLGVLQRQQQQQQQGQESKSSPPEAPDPAELERVERILRQLGYTEDSSAKVGSEEPDSLSLEGPWPAQSGTAGAAPSFSAPAGGVPGSGGAVLDPALEKFLHGMERDVGQLRADVEGLGLDLEDMRARRDLQELQTMASKAEAAREALGARLSAVEEEFARRRRREDDDGGGEASTLAKTAGGEAESGLGVSKFERRLVVLEDRIFNLQLDARLTSIPVLTGQTQSVLLKVQQLEEACEELRSDAGEGQQKLKYVEKRVGEMELGLTDLREKQSWWDERWKEVARTVRFQLDEASAISAQTRDDVTSALTRLKADCTAAVCKKLAGEMAVISEGLEECRANLRSYLRLREEDALAQGGTGGPQAAADLQEWKGFHRQGAVIGSEDATSPLKSDHLL